ncbi:MAG: ATP/GTP-binding protein, partial [Roseibium sp.]|nr:ATP/GTP-binding protein [Roseibium sp.]
KPKAQLTASVSPVIKNPPIPAQKVLRTEQEAPAPVVDPAETPIVVASAAPGLKPQDSKAETPAIASPAPAPNTLDAQRVALANGTQRPLTNESIDSRFQIARAPAQKPDNGLSEAAQLAAAELGVSGTPPVPSTTPTDDPVAAIAAATGTNVPSPSPAPRPEATLAYASASATPPSLNRSLLPSTSGQQQKPQQRVAAAQPQTPKRTQPSLSGRIPRNQIVDPLAGFASLPDKSEPTLLSGTGTTRHQAFAWLSHPNQRKLKNVMMPGNRFVAASFENTPYGDLRTDRFVGPAVVVLPVRFAR